MRSPFKLSFKLAFKSSVKLCAALSLLVALFAHGTAAQTRRPARNAEQYDEVIRVNAELVQTDVTVLDKRGRFVEDLRPERFELKVDGRAVTLSFFERVRAAVERLAYNRNTETYAGKVPISEADANRIANHRDRELFAYLVEATKNEYQLGWPGMVNMVRNRLRQINAQGEQAAQSRPAAVQQANFIVE